MWRIIGWCVMLSLVVRATDAKPGEQLFEIMPEMPVSNQDFGDALALDGNLIVIGAEDTASGAVLSAGTAYLFDAETGAQLRQFAPSDSPASRAFGNAVDISGDRLIIAAEEDNNKRGAAYIFDTAGNQLHKLLAADGATNHEFGQVVAISGNRALVGAPGSSGFRGQAYLFDVATGQQVGNPIQPAGLPSFAEFGTSLDIDGDRAIIGYDRTGRGGGAYIYDANGTLIHSLTPPTDPDTMAPIRGFGRAVAISGNIAIVGATPSDVQVLPGEFGRAYLYDVTTGQQLFELLPKDSQGEDLFGEAVRISGNLALVGARRESVLGLINQAYLFDVTTGEQIATLMPQDVVAGDEALEAIAIDGGRALGGHESFDSSGFTNNGRVLVFDTLVGDFNGNGSVDAADFTVWRDTKDQTVATYTGADANGDTVVDDLDYGLWRANFGVRAPTANSPQVLPAAAAVPEPSTLIFSLMALIFFASGRRFPV